MALVGDLKEAKKLWANSSWSGRALLVISTFLATSSISSLSDVIFKWKGFILDGVSFYREYITKPTAKFFSNYDLVLDGASIDLLILIMLLFGALFRKNAIDKSATVKVILIFYGSIIFGSLFIILQFIPRLPQLGWIGMNLSNIAVIITLFYYPIRKRYNSSDRVMYYTPIAVSIMLVLLLAAINVGLNKAL